VNLLNNYIEGGDFTNYAIYFYGTSSYPFGRVEIVGDTITNAAGTGIAVAWADTVIVDGNVVTGMGRGSYTSRKAAVWLSNVADSTLVTRNTFVGNALSGLLFTSNVQNAIVDTNLITDNADSGMVFATYPRSALNTVFGTLNTVRRNGVGIATIDNNVHFSANNIEGNGIGFYNDDADTVYVTDSWWGDALGPQCNLLDGAGGALCAIDAAGDSISGWASAFYAVSPIATDTVAAAPAGAPGTGGSPAMAPARPESNMLPPDPTPEPSHDSPQTEESALVASSVIRGPTDSRQTGGHRR
jgi:hypothetical protein